MTHASSSPHQPYETPENETSNQCQKDKTGSEISYANARVLEEGLVGCEKSVRGQRERKKAGEEKDDNDTEDHPNLRLQWTWTALRR
ncbi:hypothetical protein PtrSN002B_001978 [Pyrenophora tritici-repentis]|nr:hypothetical protein A1F99_030910 [Pyrenophora tritici-repentis]KAG9385679.1 hypothetical protein A1F94_002429 [Pyrenophora tritici-repentis]KAI0575037.1 hypothetical protein Alg215_08270 [Pyrenophora tritici-repentis]KAI0588185.1 hypothetical protein Alg130_03505 [Pyrenophora tritici-repentis]KAI0612160.1 hypothetical protein TUN205_03601 [Pyrenophora tritici-repentis]